MASDPQAGSARAPEPHTPWGSSLWYCAPQGALPARGTMLPSGLGAKGTLERAENSGTMFEGVFPSWYKVQRYPGYVLTS